jgi:anti-anti-sigma regulatory factor
LSSFAAQSRKHDSSCTKYRDGTDRAVDGRCSMETASAEEVMLNITVENIGELAVVECEGRIVQNETAYKLREAVISQIDARIVVLELSEVNAIEGGGLDMLVSLQRWARDHKIRFLLFNPSKSVRNGLKRARSISEFYIPSMEEMMALLAYASSRYAIAA